MVIIKLSELISSELLCNCFFTILFILKFVSFLDSSWTTRVFEERSNL